jgi:plastocyanin
MSGFTDAGERRRRGRRRSPRSGVVLALSLLGLSIAFTPLQRADAAGAAPTASSSVQILKDSYSPPSLTVKAGDTVTWSNTDTTPGNGHTVTSSGRGPLKSSSMGQGGTFSYTFSAAGSYPYYCAIHPDMTGTVTVQ